VEGRDAGAVHDLCAELAAEVERVLGWYTSPEKGVFGVEILDGVRGASLLKLPS